MPTPTARYRITAKDDSRHAFTSFRARLNAAGVAVRRFAGLAGVAAAGGMALLARNSLQAADEVAKLNRQTGLGTRFLSEMRGVSALVGIEFGQIAKGSRRLSQALFDAQSGLIESKRAFEDLGLSTAELAKLSPEDRFLKVVTAISAVKEEYQRTALAARLLGGRNEELIRLGALGEAQIRALREEEVRRGNSLSGEQVAAAEAALDAQTRLRKSIEGVSNELTFRFAPAIQESVDAVRVFFLPAMEIVAKEFEAIRILVGGTAAVLVQFFQGNFRRSLEIAKQVAGDFAENRLGLLEAILAPSATAERRAQQRLAEALTDNTKRALAAAQANLGNTGSPLSSVFENDLTTIKKVIGGIRQAITARQELNREEGSGGVFDTRFQSLRAGTTSADQEQLRQLRQIEAAVQGKELVRTMREVRDILARQGTGQSVAVFG